MRRRLSSDGRTLRATGRLAHAATFISASPPAPPLPPLPPQSALYQCHVCPSCVCAAPDASHYESQCGLKDWLIEEWHGAALRGHRADQQEMEREGAVHWLPTPFLPAPLHTPSLSPREQVVRLSADHGLRLSSGLVMISTHFHCCYWLGLIVDENFPTIQIAVSQGCSF